WETPARRRLPKQSEWLQGQGFYAAHDGVRCRSAVIVQGGTPKVPLPCEHACARRFSANHRWLQATVPRSQRVAAAGARAENRGLPGSCANAGFGRLADSVLLEASSLAGQ